MSGLCDHVRVTSTRAERRREPVQQRSRQRVQRMLESAMELLETQGEAAVTTRAIAERAKVPVATVYQFFPNKEAILRELLTEHLDQRDREGIALLNGMEPRSVAEVIAGIFGFHRDYLADHPEVVSLFYACRNAGLLTDPAQLRARLADAVHRSLLEWGLLRSGTPPLVSMVAVELGDRALELAYRAQPADQQTVLAEGMRAVTGYLESYG